MKRFFIPLLLSVGVFFAGCSKDPGPQMNQGYLKYKALTVEELRKPLMDLYNATSGSGWKEQPNWTEAEDIYSFKFVRVNKGGLLTIDIPENNLSGTLPESLFDLPIETMDLSSNNLSGNLPENLGANGLMVWINLYGNNLTGNIPSAASKSLSLNFNLQQNKMSGKLSEEVGKMLYSRDFDLNPQQDGYGFDIEMILQPSEEEVKILTDFYEGLSAIAKYKLKWGETHPSHWNGVFWNAQGHCAGLDLTQMHVGEIPADFNKLTSLQKIVLDQNNLKSLPSLDKLDQLFYLSLYGNELESLDKSIFNLTRLEYLNLSYNNLTGTIPQELNNLTHLQVLDLSHNLWSGPFTNLGKLVELRELRASCLKKMAPEPLPDWIGNFAELTILELFNDAFIGDLPECIKYMKALEMVDLNDNNLTGSIETFFKGHDASYHLQKLNLNYNYFSGKLPEFAPGNQLRELSLGNNRFTGQIPDSWKNLENLYNCNIENNFVEGCLPEFFGDLPALENFNCTFNMMDGVIPEKVVRCDNYPNWIWNRQKEGYELLEP